MSANDLYKMSYAVMNVLIANPDEFVIRGLKFQDEESRMRVYADVIRNHETVIEITIAINEGIRLVVNEKLVQGKMGLMKEFKYYSENNRDRKGQMLARYGYTEVEKFAHDYLIIIK